MDQLMTLFHTDLSYFNERVPVIKEIATIFIAVGWALLIGNLAFQALRIMVSGIGIETEEPSRLFLRTSMFSFLLVCSRQICDVGLGLSSTIINILHVPDAITFDPFGEEAFDTLPNAGWIIVIIVNVIIQWQLIKLFFEVAERYVILCILTYCAPLAFAMGGSKSTGEIFHGWLRMFASMCTLMVFNLVFVKLVLSALSTDPNGAAIIPWTLLVIGIVRTAKKMDSIILRIGMTPALTGSPLGSHIPGILTALTIRSMGSIVTRTFANQAPNMRHGNAAGAPPHTSPLGHHSSKNGQNFGTQSGFNSNTEYAAENASQSTSGNSANVFSHTNIPQTDSGAQAYQTVSNFHNRYSGTDGSAARQVSQAISIDADDFDDTYVQDTPSINNAIPNIQNENGTRVSPVPPSIQPLPHDFGHMDMPHMEGTSRAPIAPEPVNTATYHASKSGDILQTKEQSNLSASFTSSSLAENQIISSNLGAPNIPSQPTTQIHGSGRPAVSPVIKTGSKNADPASSPNAPSQSSAQPHSSGRPAVSPIVKTGSRNQGSVTVPNSPPQPSAQAHSTVRPSVSPAARTEIRSQGSVTVPNSPPQPSAQAHGTVRPSVSPAARTEARSQGSTIAPSLPPQPSAQAHGTIPPSVSPVIAPENPRSLDTLNISPSTPPPQHPDTSHPHTLRRSAQPLNSRIPPTKGGNHGQSRKKQK